MPYSSMEAAKAAKFPTALKSGEASVPLTLAQVNRLAALYDGIKREGKADNPMAVAIAQFKDEYRTVDGGWAKKKKALADEPAPHYKTKPKILFGPGRFQAVDGRWVEKSEADCEEMVRNFRDLAARGEYPSVTKGHPAGTGAPKYGELVDAWIDPAGNKIVGPLGKMPEDFGKSIERGEYDKVSIVFSDNFWDPTARKFRDNVITQVGVLGAKWGAYKDQDALEIDHTELAEGGGDGVVRYCLSMADMEEAPDEGGGENVDEKVEKDLREKILKLETLVAKFEAAQPDEEKEKLLAEIKDLKKKLELAEKAQKAADEKIADAALKAKEAVVDGVLEEAVTADKDGQVKMKPDEAKLQKPILLSLDDSKTIKLAGKDGKEVETSPFEMALSAIKARPAVLKLAEKSVEDATDQHPGTDDKSGLTETDKDVAKGMGLEEKEMERCTAPGFDMHAEVIKDEAKNSKDKK